MADKRKDVEVRDKSGKAPIVVRAEGEDKGDKLVIEGYAALFDVETELYDGLYEKIDRGAFDEVLKESDCRCLFNHRADNILGREGAKTLELSVDDKGLKYRCELSDAPLSRQVYEAVKREDVSQSSFSFLMGEDNWNRRGDDDVVRTILRVDELVDVAPVTFPAYGDTSVATRAQEWRDAQSAEADKNKSGGDTADADALKRRVAELEAEVATLKRDKKAEADKRAELETRFTEYRRAVKIARGEKPDEED